jgi:hypothetical protein
LSIGNLALVFASLLLGWIALFPVRRELGPLGYHVSAVPVGLLVWPVVGGFTTLARLHFQLAVVVPAAFVAVFVSAAALSFVARAYGDREAPGAREVGVASFVVAFAAIAAFSAGASLLGLTRGNYDSIYHYHALGVWLFDVGAFTNTAAGAYGFGIPAMHAVTLLFGGGWTYVIYSLLAAILGVLAVWALWDFLPPTIARRWRLTISAITALLLVTTPAYVYNSYFVHSQMITALYLTLGVTAALRAFGFAKNTATLRAEPNLGWLVVAGFSCAGITFARVDGFAYQMVVWLLVVALAMRGRTQGLRLLPFFSAAWLLEFGTYAMVTARIRMWKSSDKLSGHMAFTLLLALLLFVVFVVFVIPRLSRLRQWLSRPRVFVLLVGVAGLLAIAALAALKTSSFKAAVGNEFVNLTRAGNWGFVWYFVAGALLLSLLVSRARKASPAAIYLLFSLYIFALVALAVHGASHSGRVGEGDTFNRIVFHALPLAFVYIGLFAGGLVGMLRESATNEAE